ncbi:MAG TPA: hypothetical protein VNR51_05245 [Hyphomicrobium sp.]|nr:hypothetical protein [Hyphomicrobium sp.]
MADSIELTDIALRIIGAFYAFAGFLATRAGLTSHFLDRAIAAISMKKTSPHESAQTAWLIAGAAIVYAGGVVLLAGLEAAVFLFALSTLAQAAYIYYLAPRYFDVEDPPDPRGRRQTTNAFVIYAAATGFVLWAAWRGRLTSLADASHAELIAITCALLLYGGYLLRALLQTPRAPSASALAPFDPASPSLPSHESKRIKVMADYGCDPLWALDEERYGCFSPDLIEISEALRTDLKAWAEAYDRSINMADPAADIWTNEQYAEHERKGGELALRLKRERPDLMIYVLEEEMGVVEVHTGEPASGAV